MSGYRAYRAPRDDHSRLCVPELDQVAESIDGNRKRFAAATCRWMDVPLSTVRQWAREEALDQSEAYTGHYLAENFHASNANRKSQSDAPLILSGHQPDLFHPGVWFKNFLLSSLAEKHSGIGVNILVDHDLARTLSMGVPTMSQYGQLHKESVSIDDERPAWPWEHARAKDLHQWKEFSSFVVDHLNSVGIAKPLLCDLWPNVIGALEQGRPLGESFSSARHIVERSNGLQTVELPFSRLATERSFACFVGELLTRIEVVHESYNAARLAYRLHHKIKNHLQPLPALARDGDWFEAPFWVYSATDPVRRALWVLRDRSRLRISDRQRWQVEFPSNRDFEEWFRGWRELKAANVSIRPRALTTTAFLRLAVADFFIHGIGGGKYDQMTDQIVHSLWEFPAPNYMVATATLYLPITIPGSGKIQCSERSESDVLQQIRDLQFSPERLINDAGPNEIRESLLKMKAELLKRIPSGHEKSAWHREIQSLNASIRQQSSVSKESLAGLLHEARNRDRARSILDSREFSIALFPPRGIFDHLKKLCEIDVNPEFNAEKR